MSPQWSNWSGGVTCAPREIARPASEADVAACVLRARREGLGVRVAGSGHSFSPLVATDGMLLSLDAHAGVAGHDPATRRVAVRAGTKLRDLGEPLFERGLATHNLGDIDVQALAGALATGTHGTGAALGNLPSALVGLRLVLASGDRLDLDADAENDGDDAVPIDAARVSLGALGVMVEARLQCVPAYRLHEVVRFAPAEECLEALDDEIARHRHFEFFWYPGRDLCEMKSLDPTEAGPDPLPDRKRERIDWSARVLPSVRELKFNEMEYSVPAEVGPACFRAVRERILAKHADVVWPVEYRRVAPDPGWLSPASGRETATISVHRDGRLPFRELFRDVEPLLRECGGRPHWGKVHTCTADHLAAVYPRFDEFRALRERLDPEGRFLNDHLRSLLAA